MAGLETNKQLQTKLNDADERIKELEAALQSDEKPGEVDPSPFTGNTMHDGQSFSFQLSFYLWPKHFLFCFANSFSPFTICPLTRTFMPTRTKHLSTT